MESTTVQQGETPLSLKPPCVAASAGGSLSLIGTFISSFGTLPVISILILSQSVINMIAVKGAVWTVWCDSNEAFLLPRCPTGLLSGVGPCYRSALAQPVLQVAMDTASTFPGFGRE